MGAHGRCNGRCGKVRACQVGLARGADTAHSLTDGLIVAALSFVAALASIAVLMRVVDRLGFLPFVIYRLGLAALLFWWAL